MQALDEEYLKVDAQFGGVDQRKIFTFAEKVSVFSYWTGTVLDRIAAIGYWTGTVLDRIAAIGYWTGTVLDRIAA